MKCAPPSDCSFLPSARDFQITGRRSWAISLDATSIPPILYGRTALIATLPTLWCLQRSRSVTKRLGSVAPHGFVVSEFYGPPRLSWRGGACRHASRVRRGVDARQAAVRHGGQPLSRIGSKTLGELASCARFGLRCGSKRSQPRCVG